MTLLGAYNINLHLQKVLWKQKACISWLKKGDSNTKYFQYSTILESRHNRIYEILDEHGVIHDNNDDIIHILLNHFQQRWTCQD